MAKQTGHGIKMGVIDQNEMLVGHVVGKIAGEEEYDKGRFNDLMKAVRVSNTGANIAIKKHAEKRQCHKMRKHGGASTSSGSNTLIKELEDANIFHQFNLSPAFMMRPCLDQGYMIITGNQCFEHTGINPNSKTCCGDSCQYYDATRDAIKAQMAHNTKRATGNGPQPAVQP